MNPHELEPNPHNLLRKAQAALGLAVGVGSTLSGLPDASAVQRPPAAYAEPFTDDLSTADTTSYKTESETAYETMAAGATIERIAGVDRVETAIEISRKTYPDASNTMALIANKDNFPDAMAAAPAAKACRCPILLTGAGELDARTLAEVNRIIRNNVEGKMFVGLLGGTSAISESVAQAFKNNGYGVIRYAGVDRYSTSVEIAKGFFASGPQYIYFADGRNFIDPMLAGSAASTTDHLDGPTELGVVLLTEGEVIKQAVMDYVRSLPPNTTRKIYGVGAAASRAVAKAFPGAEQITADSPEELSVRLARKFPAYKNGDIGLVTKKTFPDGLNAASFTEGALLVTGDNLTQSQLAFLENEVRPYANRGVVFGGTAAISDSTAARFGQALKG